MTDPNASRNIQIDTANVIDGAGSITPTSEATTKTAPQGNGVSIISRMALSMEKEAHLLGVDIEHEIAGILAKLRSKAKQ